MDSRPVQGEDAEGHDNPREIQHLSLRRPQGEGDRSLEARHAREHRDDDDRRVDARYETVNDTNLCNDRHSRVSIIVTADITPSGTAPLPRTPRSRPRCV